MAGLPTQYKRWLYNTSLFAILLLVLCSYYLSSLAQVPHLASQLFFQTQNLGWLTIAQYSLIASFMLLAWALSDNKDTLKHYRKILIVAVMARILLLGVEPYSSNDVDRYLFDGRIAVEGLDPYSVSHDDPALIELRALWHPPKEHAAYVTLYPPLALAIFSFSASAGVEYAQLVWKSILLLASLITLFLTTLILKKQQKLKHLALVALSPLLILETGVGLHLDALSTLTVVGAIYAWQQKNNLLCGIVIGIGMLLKILPIMLLLPLVFIQSQTKAAGKLIFAAIFTVFIGYSFAIVLGYHPVGSLSVFFEKWRFAAPLFSLLELYTEGLTLISILFSFLLISALAIAYLCFKQRTASLNNFKP